MLNLLERAMTVSALRARVLAQNLAQANTPDYRRQDVPFFAVMRQVVSSSADSMQRAEADVQAAPRPDGNTVTLEKEAAAIAENSILYQAMVRFASSALSQIKLAITEGRR